MQKRLIVVVSISCLLIALFLYAALSKWMDFREFQEDMFNQPFSRGFSRLLLYILPSVEIGVAILLLFDKTRSSGLWASLILMGAFTIYIILIIANYYGRIPCSCGGIIGALSWEGHLVFNLFFVAISLIGIYLQKRLNNAELK